MIKNPLNIFPYTYRFILVPKKNHELNMLIKKVEIDYLQNIIVIDIMEMYELSTDSIPTLDWIKLIKESTENFTLTAFDENGGEIYSIEFSQAKAFSHKVIYDYDSTDPVTHKIGFECVKATHLEKGSKSLTNHL